MMNSKVKWLTITAKFKNKSKEYKLIKNTSKKQKMKSKICNQKEGKI